ncbi:hypothetical protein B9Q02_06955 [Candidatus Marsarchaeota G1 archaeon BE_D]|uniref:4Fe-4S ferredoxin-type domain-containing protein n=2 Tax=Candidatus Marsarchaeota TaxID=1978152 RepID=A0A2R6BZQ5_9ARCH|nr:MAG: hypothetical protein B9Q02_06955 [Candidatus Marsarchaeota G1 archaeon BE_D]PSO04120.1 MAG: hypothetical protein B9Q12_02950 [Candidatus Marsarchaeota G2 archaeon ECH_B_SAG-G06]
MTIRNDLLTDKIDQALKQRDKVVAIRTSLKRLRENRRRALLELTNFEKLRELAKQIKDKNTKNLKTNIETFTRALENQGGKVHFASSAEEACRLVYQIVSAKDVKLVVKSKSMTTEELKLNEYLERMGITVVDTDLGERVLQLARDKPAHIVAPAIHYTRRDFAQIISKNEGVWVESDPEKITQSIRLLLRKRFLSAQAAISGANFLIARSGSVVLVTNEGNGRLGPSVPPLYIVVAGVEKIVQNEEDAALLLELLARSATGQSLTVYTTFTTGPQRMADGSLQELHVVLVDNGRMRARETELGVALWCIRCGACLNTCPTFNVLGGHVFGGVYPGPMGVLWSAIIEGYDNANNFSDLCISCGLCSSVCPTKIPIAETIMLVKSKGKNRRGKRLSEKILASVGGIERFASKAPKIWNTLVLTKFTKSVMDLIGLDPRRTPPKVEKEFEPSAKELTGFVYFSDIYARYNEPKIAYELEKIFKEVGLSVYYPIEQTEAGMPYLSYGMIEKARKCARKNVQVLLKYVSSGCKIVTTEPTALYLLRHVYPFLLKSREADFVAQNSYSVAQIVYSLVKERNLSVYPKFSQKRVFYHVPCHARALGEEYYLPLLKLAGYEVVTSDVTCCGIAGTFGYKKGALGYELSMVVGEELFEQMAKFGEGIYSTDSSVCSIQIKDALKKSCFHPLFLFGVG